MQMYRNKEYAAARLIGTIVRTTEGIPIHIDGIIEDAVRYRKIQNGEEAACLLKDLDINPVPLGYVKVGRGYQYASRLPKRDDWRQGLRNNTLVLRGGGHPGDVNWADLHSCIVGNYPELPKCGPNDAFSREFRLVDDVGIWYKDLYEVGTVLSKKEMTFNLHPKFNWIRENLEEALHA